LAWKVEIKSSAVKEIARFDKTIQRRIFDFLREGRGLPGSK
jgi:mRNA-degrading endonuclease RelE of RelBE toxin-antitoxin system